MKILHLISSVGFFGAENVLLELSSNTTDESLQAIIGVLNNKRNPHVELYDIAVKRKIPCVLFDCRSRFDLRTVFAIRKYIREQNIEIIHSHGYKSNLYGYFGSAFLNIKRVATVHLWVKIDFRLVLYSIFDKLFLRFFDAIIAVSDDIRKEIISSIIPASKVTHVSNGVNTANFYLQGKSGKILSEFSLEPSDIVVGTVGRLSMEKGHKIFLNAAKGVTEAGKNVKFMLVGDGPQRNELEIQCEQLQIKNNVIFTGVRTDLPELLSVFDVFILPSLIEGMPMALLEAMAAKKVIIVTDVGDIKKVITNGQTGIIIQPNNAKEIERAILSFINDRRKYSLLAENAFNLVNKLYSAEAMRNKYLLIYRAVLNKGRK